MTAWCPLTGEHRDAVVRQVRELAEDGLRVIAVAVKRLGGQHAPGGTAGQAARGTAVRMLAGPAADPGPAATRMTSTRWPPI